MSTAAAVIGLTYGGQDVQDLDGIFLEIIEGLGEGPTYRGTDTIVPAATGRTRRNRVKDQLIIELRGWVCGTGVDEAAMRSDFATNRKALLDLFDPTLGDQDLVAMLEDGSTATIAAMRRSPIVYSQVVPAYAGVSIELEAVEDWDHEPAGS